MTDSPASDPSEPAIDQVPAEHGDDDTQNAPLPDGGPTDGTHGVDGSDDTGA